LNLNDDSKEFAFLINEKGKKFASSFDIVFSSEMKEIVHTPFRAPKANAFAERWVRNLTAIAVLAIKNMPKIPLKYAICANNPMETPQ
jgi:hypothetical protein